MYSADFKMTEQSDSTISHSSFVIDEVSLEVVFDAVVEIKAKMLTIIELFLINRILLYRGVG